MFGSKKLKVTTIRYGVTMPEVDAFIAQYLSDERASKRLDAQTFRAMGRSRTVIEENGMQIETIIETSNM